MILKQKLVPTDQSNFKIILLKRLKQLLSKLIWPLLKNGQTNPEIRLIRLIKASNKGLDVLTIFVYSRVRYLLSFPHLAWADFKIKVKQIAHSTVHFDQWNLLISKM